MEINLIAERIKCLREDIGHSQLEMAKKLGITQDEYEAAEEGNKDFSFNFLRQTAEILQIDLADLITGESAKLTTYTIDKANTGLEVYRRSGFDYLQLASKFKNKNMQPYVVTVPFTKEHSDDEIYVSGHEGQEFNYILEGTIKITVAGNTEILNKGDSIFFDSGKPHGMVAVGGKAAKFIAIITK